jgi:hypothetical protein
MNSSKYKGNGARFQLIVWIVVPLFAFVVFAIVYPSTIYLSTEEIDINSGVIRERECYLSILLRQSDRDTWVSLARTPMARPADWQVVNSRAFLARFSAHYVYHAAPTQCQLLEMLDEILPFAELAKRRVADQVLSYWQMGSDDAADTYIHSLSRANKSALDRGKKAMSIDDLPIGEAAHRFPSPSFVGFE